MSSQEIERDLDQVAQWLRHARRIRVGTDSLARAIEAFLIKAGFRLQSQGQPLHHDT